MAAMEVRRYAAEARSTETFGRVLGSARTQHFVVDGPVQNGCPGEALSPAELFLAGVVTCGVELVQVIAKDENVPVQGVRATIEAVQDRSQPPRPDVSLFNRVRVEFHLKGVTQEQGAQLIDSFKRR
jgi:uncharacterized OsmC-like protein